MTIYPAIDLQSGKCVRLYQGCYEKVTLYAINPMAMARNFANQGATFLHIVDLDGAQKGNINNFSLITKIAQETGLKVQTGGGIRSRKQISDYLEQGIERVILGSVAINQPQKVIEWILEFGSEHIVLALDNYIDEKQIPKLVFHGWQTTSEKSLWQLLDEYQEAQLKHVLCTDIHCDGTLTGPNINLYQECVARYPALHFQASGGISSLDDLVALAAIPVAGAVVGKALYENKFSLEEALC